VSASSRALAWEFSAGSSSFQSREARVSSSWFPSWSSRLYTQVPTGYKNRLRSLCPSLHIEDDLLQRGCKLYVHLQAKPALQLSAIAWSAFARVPNGYLGVPAEDVYNDESWSLETSVNLFRKRPFYGHHPIHRRPKPTS
jgi:hypothetical protein